MESDSSECQQPEELNEYAWRNKVVHLRWKGKAPQDWLCVLVQVEGLRYDRVAIEQRMHDGQLEHSNIVFIEISDAEPDSRWHCDEVESYTEGVDRYWSPWPREYAATSYYAWYNLPHKYGQWWVKELLDDTRRYLGH